MRKRIILLLSLVMVCMVNSASFAVTEDALSTNNPDDAIINVRQQIVELSNCKGAHSFSDREEINLIAEKYALGDPADIDEIIYVPFNEAKGLAASDENITSSESEKGNGRRNASASTTYYVKKNGSSEERGGLIRSSTYRYPGGTMTITESVSRGWSFTESAGISVSDDIVKAKISAAYNISFSKKDTVSDSQDIKVKAYHKRNVKAYDNKRIYKGELWKKYLRKGDWVNTKCGNTKVTRGVGVIFVVGKNVKL